MQHGLVDVINLCKGLNSIDDPRLQYQHYLPLHDVHLLDETEGQTYGCFGLRL